MKRIYGAAKKFLLKFKKSIFHIRPRDKNDYYRLGRYLISRRLVSLIIFIIGILGLCYFMIMNPFLLSGSPVKTYNYDSLLLKFASGKVNIKAKSGYTAYSGTVSDGKVNGKGTLYDKSGDIKYKGDFKDNEFSGKGTLYTDDGVYKGEFKDNKQEGEGELLRPNGSLSYKGEFSGGEKSGEGELYDLAGQPSYKGGFLSDMPVYTDFLGISTSDAAAIYMGKRTVYYNEESFAVDMEDIHALYAGSSGDNYLDDSVKIEQVFIKSDTCIFDGKSIDSIRDLKEIAGEPSFEGYSYMTMPEAVALGEELKLGGSLEDAKEVISYSRDKKLYLTMFEYHKVQYTFYGYEAGDTFVMYEVENG